jgi:hypothetical protein
MKYLLREWSTMTPVTPFLIVTSMYEVFVEGMEYDNTFHTFSHCDLTVWSIYWVDGVRWHLSYLCSLWPHCMKYLLRGWSMMTPFTPFLIVTSLTEVFIEGTEYDGTFHACAHCDLIVWSIYWGDGVWWHLSHLFSLWPHWLKYLLRGWSTMTSLTSLLLTSLCEVFIERMEYGDTFHTFSHCDLTDWSIYWGDGVRWHLSYLFLILTSLYEVCIEWVEYNDIFHISDFDLIVWSIYWEDGVRWHLSYIFTLWPHWLKYLLRVWSTMTPCIPFSHCDLIVWSMYWVGGVQWHLSHLCLW